ncbi:unnamed protein product [Vitrella brassicaformis CCMP3155]|uniref:MIF4G domain-containing protein n=4 Tax=Vitrella brassicaformis TaxID=1169539 RepID=A0A0G4FU18_VITBC|nr:unnamed protein product [Vitrella brassicaformis CCMP3155]|eukprot:CEM18459.1 unnamed protein product [Vitrella brassicaformis CCMP3155]
MHHAGDPTLVGRQPVGSVHNGSHQRYDAPQPQQHMPPVGGVAVGAPPASAALGGHAGQPNSVGGGGGGDGGGPYGGPQQEYVYENLPPSYAPMSKGPMNSQGPPAQPPPVTRAMSSLLDDKQAKTFQPWHLGPRSRKAVDGQAGMGDGSQEGYGHQDTNHMPLGGREEQPPMSSHGGHSGGLGASQLWYPDQQHHQHQQQQQSGSFVPPPREKRILEIRDPKSGQTINPTGKSEQQRGDRDGASSDAGSTVDDKGMRPSGMGPAPIDASSMLRPPQHPATAAPSIVPPQANGGPARPPASVPPAPMAAGVGAGAGAGGGLPPQPTSSQQRRKKITNVGLGKGGEKPSPSPHKEASSDEQRTMAPPESARSSPQPSNDATQMDAVGHPPTDGRPSASAASMVSSHSGPPPFPGYPATTPPYTQQQQQQQQPMPPPPTYMASHHPPTAAAAAGAPYGPPQGDGGPPAFQTPPPPHPMPHQQQQQQQKRPNGAPVRQPPPPGAQGMLASPQQMGQGGEYRGMPQGQPQPPPPPPPPPPTTAPQPTGGEQKRKHRIENRGLKQEVAGGKKPAGAATGSLPPSAMPTPSQPQVPPHAHSHPPTPSQMPGAGMSSGQGLLPHPSIYPHGPSGTAQPPPPPQPPFATRGHTTESYAEYPYPGPQVARGGAAGPGSLSHQHSLAGGGAAQPEVGGPSRPPPPPLMSPDVVVGSQGRPPPPAPSYPMQQQQPPLMQQQQPPVSPTPPDAGMQQQQQVGGAEGRAKRGKNKIGNVGITAKKPPPAAAPPTAPQPAPSMPPPHQQQPQPQPHEKPPPASIPPTPTQPPAMPPRDRRGSGLLETPSPSERIVPPKTAPQGRDQDSWRSSHGGRPDTRGAPSEPYKTPPKTMPQKGVAGPYIPPPQRSRLQNFPMEGGVQRIEVLSTPTPTPTPKRETNLQTVPEKGESEATAPAPTAAAVAEPARAAAPVPAPAPAPAPSSAPPQQQPGPPVVIPYQPQPVVPFPADRIADASAAMAYLQSQQPPHHPAHPAAGVMPLVTAPPIMAIPQAVIPPIQQLQQPPPQPQPQPVDQPSALAAAAASAGAEEGAGRKKKKKITNAALPAGKTAPTEKEGVKAVEDQTDEASLAPPSGPPTEPTSPAPKPDEAPTEPSPTPPPLPPTQAPEAPPAAPSEPPAPPPTAAGPPAPPAAAAAEGDTVTDIEDLKPRERPEEPHVADETREDAAAAAATAAGEQEQPPTAPAAAAAEEPSKEVAAEEGEAEVEEEEGERERRQEGDEAAVPMALPVSVRESPSKPGVVVVQGKKPPPTPTKTSWKEKEGDLDKDPFAAPKPGSAAAAAGEMEEPGAPEVEGQEEEGPPEGEEPPLDEEEENPDNWEDMAEARVSQPPTIVRRQQLADDDTSRRVYSRDRLLAYKPPVSDEPPEEVANLRDAAVERQPGGAFDSRPGFRGGFGSRATKKLGEPPGRFGVSLRPGGGGGLPSTVPKFGQDFKPSTARLDSYPKKSPPSDRRAPPYGGYGGYGGGGGYSYASPPGSFGRAPPPGADGGYVPVPKPSANAYRVTKPTERNQVIERDAKSKLNKLTIEKFEVIAEKLAQQGEQLQSEEELDLFVAIVFEKAVSEPNFSEMYADLCQILRWRSPEFPHEKEKGKTFYRALLNKCQEEFEKLPETKMTLSDEDKAKLSSDDQEIKLKKLKDRILGNIKFIGELFLRRLLSAKVVKEVVTSLIGADASYSPEELFIECLCKLITTIGSTLESTDAGKQLLTHFSSRMKELKAQDKYSKRIKFALQDVLDLRQNDWRQKVHKEKAKSLRDIRKDVEREEAMGGAIHAAQQGTFQFVGRKTDTIYASYMDKQREAFDSKEKAKKEKSQTSTPTQQPAAPIRVVHMTSAGTHAGPLAPIRERESRAERHAAQPAPLDVRRDADRSAPPTPATPTSLGFAAPTSPPEGSPGVPPKQESEGDEFVLRDDVKRVVSDYDTHYWERTVHEWKALGLDEETHRTQLMAIFSQGLEDVKKCQQNADLLVLLASEGVASFADIVNMWNHFVELGEDVGEDGERRSSLDDYCLDNPKATHMYAEILYQTLKEAFRNTPGVDEAFFASLNSPNSPENEHRVNEILRQVCGTCFKRPVRWLLAIRKLRAFLNKNDTRDLSDIQQDLLGPYAPFVSALRSQLEQGPIGRPQLEDLLTRAHDLVGEFDDYGTLVLAELHAAAETKQEPWKSALEQSRDALDSLLGPSAIGAVPSLSRTAKEKLIEDFGRDYVISRHDESVLASMLQEWGFMGEGDAAAEDSTAGDA